MSGQDHTVCLGHADKEGRTLAALSLALATGRSLGEVEIDLTDPAQCRFGAYTLVERIGVGGMGLVYRAHQLSLERDVAIKILNMEFSANSEALARFRFEAKSAAALNHPNIVQILEIGDVDGIAFIAMQLVRGETLADRIGRERPGISAAVALMLKLCDAVGYAHRLQLLHLDLKPANVLINERDEPLVADFGLARQMNSKGQVESQEVSGTPGYMAPEQVLIKEFRLSVGTDIYALGAILYEMLCGLPPHGRGAAADVIQRALAGQIQSPRAINSAVPKDLEAICLKCLNLRSAERYGSVEALADDLRRFANGLPVSVRSPTRRERLQRWYAREPKFASALAVLMLLALGGSFVFASLYREAERERAGAEGLARLLMSQTPTKAPPILHPVGGFKVPVIDCTETNINCGGGLDPYATIDPKLPLAQRRRYLESLRAYVSKIAAWGNPHLSAQLAQKLDGAEASLYQIRRAKAAAKTNTPEGFLFAYLLAVNLEDPELDRKQVVGWFDRALAGIDQPWQAQALAQTCGAREPACSRAITRFRELDPDNAATWIVGLPDKLAEEGDQRLLRAASSTRLDNHASDFLDAAAAFANRLAPTLDPSMRVTPAEFALAAWTQTGTFAYPHHYCKQSFGERAAPAIEEACRAVIAKFQPAMHPMMLDEIMAAVLTKRMSNDPAVQKLALQRLRNARWVYSVWKQLPPGFEPDANTMFRIYRDQGEFAYLKSLVVAAHLPLEAPEEFVTREPLPWPRRAPASAQSGQ